MQTAIYLPRLELTMDHVRVAGVHVSVGDCVCADQPLIEVETEKAVQPVPAPKAGFIRKLFVRIDDRLGEGALIGVLTDTAEEPLEPSLVLASPKPKGAESPSPSPGLAPQPPTPADGIKAAPAARKLARDLRVDLGTIQGTGPGGRITVDDVQRASQTTVREMDSVRWEPLPPRRLALIAQMQKSLAEIPQFHVARQLEVEPLLSKSHGWSFTVRLIYCAAQALVSHPHVRTVLRGEQARVAPVSVAVAMETSRGLVAPALRKAELESLSSIAVALKSLRRRAEEGTLRQEELDAAPFAISNLGMFEVDVFSAFVFHGQTAVLAVGRTVENKAWFNLAADHRILDGAEAARFLRTLQERISVA